MTRHGSVLSESYMKVEDVYRKNHYSNSIKSKGFGSQQSSLPKIERNNSMSDIVESCRFEMSQDNSILVFNRINNSKPSDFPLNQYGLPESVNHKNQLSVGQKNQDFPGFHSRNSVDEAGRHLKIAPRIQGKRNVSYSPGGAASDQG